MKNRKKYALTLRACMLEWWIIIHRIYVIACFGQNKTGFNLIFAKWLSFNDIIRPHFQRFQIPACSQHLHLDAKHRKTWEIYLNQEYGRDFFLSCVCENEAIHQGAKHTSWWSWFCSSVSAIKGSSATVLSNMIWVKPNRWILNSFLFTNWGKSMRMKILEVGPCGMAQMHKNTVRVWLVQSALVKLGIFDEYRKKKRKCSAWTQLSDAYKLAEEFSWLAGVVKWSRWNFEKSWNWRGWIECVLSCFVYLGFFFRFFSLHYCEGIFATRVQLQYVDRV